MIRLLVCVVILLFTPSCNSGIFICNKSKIIAITTQDGTFKKEIIKSNFYKINRIDLVQAYSGQPVFLKDSWLTVVMLPTDTANTRTAYSYLDLPYELAVKVTEYPSLVDLKIKIVQNEDELIWTVREIAPSVGYSTVYIGRQGPESCF